MLENDFLRYIEEQKSFANWIVDRVSYYMEWHPVSVRHRDFKMADDLNRLAMNIQLRQTGDLTRQTVLEEASHDPSVEAKIRKKEDNDRREESRQQALAQAEAQGELQLVQARYQQKIQRMMGGQQPFVDQMGGQQMQVNPAMAGPQGNPAEVMGYNLAASPDALVRAVREQPQQAPDMLRQLQANYPGIYTEVMQRLNPPSQIRQLPEQRPPRRSAEKALI